MNKLQQIMLKTISRILLLGVLITTLIVYGLNMPLEIITDIMLAWGSLLFKIYEIQLQVLIIIGYMALEIDFRDIMVTDIVNRLLFVLVHLATFAYTATHFRHKGQNPQLIRKQSLITFKSWQQKRDYSTKKTKATLVPITLTPKDVTDDFKHKIAVTGTFGTRLTYQDMFKIIPIDRPKNPKSTTIFHNSLFATWDIETLADAKGVECAYMISWVVSKGTKVDKGVVANINNWTTNEGKVQITKEFLTGLINRVKQVNNNVLPKELFLYAHNSGIFDIHVIIKSLIAIYREEPKKSIPTIIADRRNDIYQLRINLKRMNLNFRDSMKLLPISLKTVASNILGVDMNKFELNHDRTRILFGTFEFKKLLLNWNLISLKIINNNKDISDNFETPFEYLKAYCAQDSLIVIEALKKLSIELSKLGFNIPIKECITASSIGMKVWKAHFNRGQNPIIQININTNIHIALDKAYFGGRVEVFNSGLNIRSIYHFDVPGLYAGIMCKELPVGNPVYVSKYNSSIEDFHKLLLRIKDSGLTGFFQCEAKAPENLNLPVLPVKWNGKLIFPLGSFVGTWALVELVQAIEIGYELTPIDGWIFKAGTPLKSYSEKMTELKDKAGAEGNKAARTLMKLLINSLYGKLASKYFTRASAIIKNDDFATINEIYKLNAITKLDDKHILLNYNIKPIANDTIDKDLMKKAFLRRTEAISDKDLNIAVAATVTAQGRVQLYKLMKEVTDRGGVICYTDTDSVFATLPERPFNKPFGPYTWVGPAEEHTFNKALFIAPKMYYHEDLSGKITFKVKGVNTKTSSYSYEDLTSNFIRGVSIIFTNQTQYRRTPKNDDRGIIIINSLEKAYDLGTNSKRIWYTRATEAYTTPYSITKEQLMKAKAITKLPVRNLSLAIITLEDIHHAKPIVPTSRNTVSRTIEQYINPSENAITISILMADIEETLLPTWSHALSTAAFNCIDKDMTVANLDNMKYAQILVADSTKNVWKTIAYFKGSEWIGYTMENIKTEIMNQIEVLNRQYNQAYEWSELIIKLNFDKTPEIVSYNLDTTIIKAIQDIGEARKAFNETLEVKKTIEKLEAKIEIMTKMSQSSKGIIQILKTAQRTALQTFIKEVKLDLYNHTTLKSMTKERIMHIIPILKVSPDIEVNRIRNLLAEVLIKRLEVAITQDFKLSYHRWVNKVEKILKVDLQNEEIVRNTHILVFRALETILKREHLELYTKNVKYIDHTSKTIKTTPSTYVLRDKWNTVQSILYQIGLLSSVSFTPKILQYDAESTDNTLKSKDKVIMINKLNSVKMFMRPTYLKYLEETLFPLANEPEKLGELIGLKTPSEINAIIVEIRTIKICILYIKTWIRATSQDFYYNTYFRDSRGRVYAELTNFRHIGPKWLRPLFCMEKSRLSLGGSWKAALMMMGMSEEQADTMSTYWKKVGTELNIDISKYIFPKDLLTAMKSITADKLNPQLIARTLELEELILKGKLDYTRPFQRDMKNNAIQHAATLVNNTDSILATGVLPSEWETEDLYIKIAKRTLNKIRANRHILEFAELVDKFPTDTDLNKEKSVKLLRAIAKKPTIVSIYSATKHTIRQYVYEILHEIDLSIAKASKQLLATIVIEASLRASRKEIILIETMKRIVTGKRRIIEWNFGTLSDFKPRETYNKIEQKDFKIRFENKQFHTTYNLLTNKVDTQAMKYATFVNIIHSLDALHLNLVINRLTDTSILTIHDAFLTSWSYNNTELYQQISEKFIAIHNEHNAFKSAFNRLAERLGRDWTYDNLLKYLDIIPPIIKTTGRMM